MTRGLQRTGSRAALLLGVAALLLFARLTLRHVGESYFLADQVDQLQKYEAALRLEPEGLWGPAMSGTQARALGPFGALVFGAPVSLGLGIDSIHAVTSLMLAAATAVAFWQLTSIDAALAWGWLIVFVLMRMVWWNAAMFWVNTLLLPLGLLFLALFAASLRTPSAPRLLGMLLVLFLALQVHLAALVGLPLLALAAIALWRTGRAPADRRIVALLLAVVIMTAVPYITAEVMTGFRNTRAMLTHVDTAVHSNPDAGEEAAIDTLVLAADPMAVLAGHAPLRVIAAGAALSIAAFALLGARRRRSAPAAARAHLAPVTGLLVAAVVGMTAQALFFRLMARPLNGLHYAMFLAPWYPIPAAALVACVLPPPDSRRFAHAAAVLAAGALLVLVFRAPLLADRYAERTPWTYRAIVTALNRLCAGEAVRTVEGPGLLNELTPSSDSVLRYLMKRRLTSCRYSPDADVAIIANRNGDFGEVRDVDGVGFVREVVLPPGIGRYRRVP